MQMFYDHKARKITDDSGREYTFKEAHYQYANGKLSDMNMAFKRLLRNQGDMDAVEAEYKEIDGAI